MAMDKIKYLKAYPHSVISVSHSSMMMMGSDIGNTVLFDDYKLENDYLKFLLELISEVFRSRASIEVHTKL